MASTDLALGRHRILFIDAYDSFANNIVALLKTKLEEVVEIEVTIIRIDAYIPDFLKFLKGFDAVVAGPGPGDPRDVRDVGWMRQLWSLQGADLLPVLGICLGFQSLVLAFGGMVDQLPDSRHGIETYIDHNNNHIFYGLNEIRAVQYHSFNASLHHVMPQEPVDMFPGYLFKVRYIVQTCCHLRGTQLTTNVQQDMAEIRGSSLWLCHMQTGRSHSAASNFTRSQSVLANKHSELSDIGGLWQSSGSKSAVRIETKLLS